MLVAVVVEVLVVVAVMAWMAAADADLLMLFGVEAVSCIKRYFTEQMLPFLDRNFIVYYVDNCLTGC